MTLSINSSVSWRNDCLRLSSKSGKRRRSGVTDSKFLRWSHWPAKFVTKLLDLESAKRRSACSRRISGSLNFPAIARSRSSSSGKLLHKKNESRLANSRSEMWYAFFSKFLGSRSTRNRNSGLTSMDDSVRSIPPSKPPSCAPSR
jgi:hypothetical protein